MRLKVLWIGAFLFLLQTNPSVAGCWFFGCKKTPPPEEVDIRVPDRVIKFADCGSWLRLVLRTSGNQLGDVHKAYAEFLEDLKRYEGYPPNTVFAPSRTLVSTSQGIAEPVQQFRHNRLPNRLQWVLDQVVAVQHSLKSAPASGSVTGFHLQGKAAQDAFDEFLSDLEQTNTSGLGAIPWVTRKWPGLIIGGLGLGVLALASGGLYLDIGPEMDPMKWFLFFSGLAGAELGFEGLFWNGRLTDSSGKSRYDEVSDLEVSSRPQSNDYAFHSMRVRLAMSAQEASEWLQVLDGGQWSQSPALEHFADQIRERIVRQVKRNVRPLLIRLIHGIGSFFRRDKIIQEIDISVLYRKRLMVSPQLVVKGDEPEDPPTHQDELTVMVRTEILD